MKQPPPVLALFPSAFSCEEVKAGVAEIKALLVRRGTQAEVTDSLSWYQAKFSACGNWDSWALETVTGKGYSDRRPHFSAFIYAGPSEVGLGNGKVLSLALDYGKPVYWAQEGSLDVVGSIRQVGGGWQLTKKEGLHA